MKKKDYHICDTDDFILTTDWRVFCRSRKMFVEVEICSCRLSDIISDKWAVEVDVCFIDPHYFGNDEIVAELTRHDILHSTQFLVKIS